jgi:hypothetical protein
LTADPAAGVNVGTGAAAAAATGATTGAGVAIVRAAAAGAATTSLSRKGRKEENVCEHLLLACPCGAYIPCADSLAKAMDARADVAERAVDLAVDAGHDVGEGRVVRQDRVREIETRTHDV